MSVEQKDNVSLITISFNIMSQPLQCVNNKTVGTVVFDANICIIFFHMYPTSVSEELLLS